MRGAMEMVIRIDAVAPAFAPIIPLQQVLNRFGRLLLRQLRIIRDYPITPELMCHDYRQFHALSGLLFLSKCSRTHSLSLRSLAAPARAMERSPQGYAPFKKIAYQTILVPEPFL